MRGIPPHLLPPPPEPAFRIRCGSCGFEIPGAPVRHCPGCAHRLMQIGVPAKPLVMLVCMIIAGGTATWLTYDFLWKTSDYTLGVTREMSGTPLSKAALRQICFEESWIPAVVVAIIGSAICLGYAY